MSSHLAFRRGRAFALLALLTSVVGPAWAVCNGNPASKFDPANGQTVPERTGGNFTTVTLDGSKSTPGNNDLLFQWSYLGSTPSGLSVTLSNTTAQKPTFTAPNVGPGGATLNFQLRVTCGNQSDTATTVVNVTDIFINAPPVASAFISPLNATEGQTVTLDGSGSSDPDSGQALTYAWSQISGSPNVSLTNASPNGSVMTFVAPNLPGTTTLGFRLTVSDGFLTSSTDKTVSIVFTNDPPIASLNCPTGGVLTVDEGNSVNFTSAGSSDPEGDALTYAWSQNAGLPNLNIGGTITPTLSFSAPHLGYQQLGGTSITLTVTDALNASASKTCGLFINDVTPPVIVVPNDITAEATKPQGADVPYTATSQDAVEDLLPVPLACVPPSGSTFPLDVSTLVGCTAQDANNNTSNESFHITVEDTTPPILTVPGDTAVEATSAAGALGTYTATQIDLVDGTSAADCAPPSGSTFPFGDTTVTCSAVDSHGNAADDQSFVFSVMDTTPPVIDPHADLADVEATSAAGATVTYTAPATHDAVDGNGTATCAPPSGNTFPLGHTEIGCNAIDTHGNAATPVSFGVNVVDTTAPVIAAHGNIEDIEATSAAGAVATYIAPSWTDAVDGTGSASCLPASGATFALGVTTVHCNHTDNAGNAAAETIFTVEVVDTTPPEIVAHSNIMGIEATGPGGASVTYVAPLWTDAVSGSGSATCAPASGATFPLGTTTVTCNAEDEAGNDASPTTFTIQVVDTTAPTIDPVADILDIEATGPNGAPVSYTSPATHDAVDGNGTASCVPASGSIFPLGPTTVTCSAIDAAGNDSSEAFTVEVVDTTAPVIDPHGNVGPIEATGASGAVATYTPPLARDIVDADKPATCTPASGTTFELGQTTVTCTATDTAGNAATPTQFQVTVHDTTAPVIAAHADVTVEATSGLGAIATYASPATSDAVDGNGTATCAAASGTQFPLGSTTVTCNATDAAGNAATPTTFEVHVVDTTAPTLQSLPDINVIASANSSAVVTWTLPTATDAVDATPTIACDPAPGSTFGMGATTVTCTATDDAGNKATDEFLVTVRYAFSGFFSPVDNVPTVNTVSAGQSIPVKFSLGGFQGMAIFASGYPKSIVMPCGGAAQDAVEETSTAGSSTLTYDPGTGRYHYVWKTEKAWSSTCRQLQIRFADGTTQVANFYFRK